MPDIATELLAEIEYRVVASLSPNERRAALYRLATGVAAFVRHEDIAEHPTLFGGEAA